MIRIPTESDFRFLAEHLREADRIELEAQSGTKDVLSALRRFSAASIECYVNHDENPGVIFGISPYDEEAFSLWLLGTDEISKRPIEFCKAAKFVLRAWGERYPQIRYYCNFTYAENHVHHQWLRWLGASLGPAFPYGVNGEHFRPFVLMKE